MAASNYTRAGASVRGTTGAGSAAGVVTAGATAGPGGTSSVEQLLERAGELRLRHPDLAMVLGERAAALAESSGADRLWVRAESLVVSTRVRLGVRAPVVPRAVAALRAAEDGGHAALDAGLRTDLAICARSVGTPLIGLAAIRPLLADGEVLPSQRAVALTQLVGCLAQLGRKSELERVLVEADRLCVADDTLDPDGKLLHRALVRVAGAAHRRRHGDPTGAADAARTGLGFLDRLDTPESECGVVRVRLVLHLVCTLLDRGEAEVAMEIAEPVLEVAARAGAIAPVAWLQLALAMRVHLPAGAGQAAARLLREALHNTERSGLHALTARLWLELSHVEEQVGSAQAALDCLNRARELEYLHARARRQACGLLAGQFGAGEQAPVDLDEVLAWTARRPSRAVSGGPAQAEPEFAHAAAAEPVHPGDSAVPDGGVPDWAVQTGAGRAADVDVPIAGGPGHEDVRPAARAADFADAVQAREDSSARPPTEDGLPRQDAAHRDADPAQTSRGRRSVQTGTARDQDEVTAGHDSQRGSVAARSVLDRFGIAAAAGAGGGAGGRRRAAETPEANETEPALFVTDAEPDTGHDPERHRSPAARGAGSEATPPRPEPGRGQAGLSVISTGRADRSAAGTTPARDEFTTDVESERPSRESLERAGGRPAGHSATSGISHPEAGHSAAHGAERPVRGFAAGDTGTTVPGEPAGSRHRESRPVDTPAGGSEPARTSSAGADRSETEWTGADTAEERSAPVVSGAGDHASHSAEASDGAHRVSRVERILSRAKNESRAGLSSVDEPAGRGGHRAGERADTGAHRPGESARHSAGPESGAAASSKSSDVDSKHADVLRFGSSGTSGGSRAATGAPAHAAPPRTDGVPHQTASGGAPAHAAPGAGNRDGTDDPTTTPDGSGDSRENHSVSGDGVSGDSGDGPVTDSAFGDSAHRDSAHRDSAHRDSAHRDSAHRDSAHRDSAPADTDPANAVPASTTETNGITAESPVTGSAAPPEDSWLPRLRLPPSLDPLSDPDPIPDTPWSARSEVDYSGFPDQIDDSYARAIEQDEPAADAGLAELLARALAEHQAGSSSAAALVKRLGTHQEAAERRPVNGHGRGGEGPDSGKHRSEG